MIIHHIPIKLKHKGSFKRLVDYLTDTQGKQERVGAVRISHCHNQDKVWAVAEISATQAKNTRAKKDKTYHLVISFAAGEVINPSVIEAIEDRVVHSIGLSMHQRISVVHHDTDNLHIHVAINKIHPQTFNMMEPYHAYKKLAEVAQRLEGEYGLVKTNHIPRYQRAANLAQDMEKISGIESFNTWIKRHCLDELTSANSWSEFHHVLSEYGIQLKQRGNGFVFSTSGNISVKASSVSREFSKPKLEAHLGQFVKRPAGEVTPKLIYQSKPKNEGRTSMDLYEQYEIEKDNNRRLISEKLAVLSEKKRKLFEQAKRKSWLKRAAIKLMKSSRTSKKVMHTLVSRQYQKSAEKIKKQCAQERQAIISNNGNVSWPDWLQKKAELGDEAAIKVLRERATRTKTKQAIHGNTQSTRIINQANIDSVTKEGTAIYKVGDSTVRDNGKSISISKGLSQEALKEFLLLARQQYGQRLNITGSDLFKKTVARIAARNQIDVIFSDHGLEQFRQQLINEQENQNGQTGNRDNDARARDRGGNATSKRRSSQEQRRQPERRGRTTKPHPSRIRNRKAPQGENSLRKLSQRHVVEFPRRCEVLLSDNAHDKLERKGAKPDHKVRRNIFRLKIRKSAK